MDSRTRTPSRERTRGAILQRVVKKLLYPLNATLAIHFLLVIIMLIIAWKYQDYLEWDDGSEWMGMPEKSNKSNTGSSVGHTSQQSSGHFSRSSSGHFFQQSSIDTTHKAEFDGLPSPYKRPEEGMDDYNDWMIEPEDWILDPPNSYKFMILNIHLVLLIPPLASEISFINNSFLCQASSLLFQVISFILSIVSMVLDLYHVTTGLIITRVFFYTNWIFVILLSIIKLYQLFPRKENKVTIQEITSGQGLPLGQETPLSPPTELS